MTDKFDILEHLRKQETKGNKMRYDKKTVNKALSILYRVWGNEGCLSASDVNYLDGMRLSDDETALACCSRLAGVDTSQVVPFHPRAALAIRGLIAAREIELERLREENL